VGNSVVFSSLIFLFYFLPITLALYYICHVLSPKSVEIKNIIILFASLLFYAWGEPRLVILMLISIYFNHYLSLYLDRIPKRKSHKRKIILTLGILLNLAFLGIYKYAGFFIDNINIILEMLNIPTLSPFKLTMPIGISFYTFQAISYVIDVYRGHTKAEKRLIHTALYISFFAQLIAGPIVIYKDIVEQIKSRKHEINTFYNGIIIFTIGLFKKLIFANSFAIIADKSFDSMNFFGVNAWLGVICYSLQIYYDFSGYSDMAVGLGKMFGFKLLKNFNYPYAATSIKDFWRKWHISLSSWFKDYLYIPLGGSRTSKIKVYRNLLIVFFLTGFWHGASWNFIVWGLFYGVFLILERTKFGKYLEKQPYIIKFLYTNLIVLLAWVFFRAKDLRTALQYINNMFNFNLHVNFGHELIDSYFKVLFVLGIFFMFPIREKLINKYISTQKKYKKALFMALNMVYVIMFLFASCTLLNATYNPFIYFRF